MFTGVLLNYNKNNILLFQFIFGLGVPVVLKEQALTIGSVIKMQYLVPVNSSEYTRRIFGLANTISRYMSGDGNDVVSGDETERFETTTMNNDYAETTTENNEDENETLVDLTFDQRKKRALLYSEGGITKNDINTKEQLPLEEAIRRQELIDQKYKEQEYEPDRMNRWDFYKILERAAER